jgi:hypothetical protein
MVKVYPSVLINAGLFSLIIVSSTTLYYWLAVEEMHNPGRTLV